METEILSEWILDGTNSFWKAMKSLPKEKLNWSPGAETRTPLMIAQEVASSISYITELLKTRELPNIGAKEKEEPPKDLDLLEKIHRKNTKLFLDAVTKFPGSD